jgi:hypothetical protein
VKYYLIIDPELNAVEIYTHDGEKYQKSPASDSCNFSFENDCKATIDFTNIWE